MKYFFSEMLLLWAINDVLRRPIRAIMTVVVLAFLTFLLSAALLLHQALSDTIYHLLADSPAMVIRSINAGGWVPIPIKKALETVRSVPGVIHPKIRIWGTAAGPNGPLTILAIDRKIQTHLKNQGLPRPKPGQAIIGSGIHHRIADTAKTIRLSSTHSIELEIIAVLPEVADMATHDLVLTTAKDARFILNLPKEMAIDLTLDVFHQEEAKALIPELKKAFPWPVHISLREDAQKKYSGIPAANGAIYTMMLLPSILALVLLILAYGYDLLNQRSDTGLLRTLGWTTFDLTRMQLLRAALICLPSTTIGLGLAYAAIFFPGVRWMGRFFLGWTPFAPAYYLSSCGAGIILIEVFTLIAIPFILASMWPVFALAARSPLSLLKGEFFR